MFHYYAKKITNDIGFRLARHFFYISALVFLKLSLSCSLELNEAIQRAWTYSPTAAIASSEVEMRQAEEYQLGLLPNPIFNVEIDGADACFNRNRRKCNDQEITYTLSQLIELGGKRSARKRIGLFQTTLATFESEAVKLDIRNEVTNAFIDVMAAQEYIKLAEEQKRIAQEVHQATSAKVQGGKISSLQEKKADLALANATLVLEKARRSLELSKKKLAATWGCSNADFEEVQFPLYEIQPPEDLSRLMCLLKENIEVSKWNIQIALAENIVLNEKAQRIPDVIVTAGYYNCEDDGDGLTLGFALPIPIFNRNQGNISRARIALNQLYEKQNESMVQLRLDLEAAYDQWMTAYRESQSFKEIILSSAKLAFEAAQEEFNKGKNDYLELLDAQRTLFEVQEQYLDALVDYHQRKSDVERTIGLPLNPICSEPNF